jgi:hypothetical protein
MAFGIKATVAGKSGPKRSPVKILTSVTHCVRSAEIAVQFTKNSAGNTTLAQIGVSAYCSAGFMDRCRRAGIVLTGSVCGLAPGVVSL